MATVLLRHFPALAPALRNVQNPFAPWTRTRSAPPYRQRDSAQGPAVTAAQDGTPKVIPTVRELPLVGSLFALQSDALAFVRRVVHECGDMGRFHLGPVKGFVLGAPAAIRGVLVDDAGAFDKGGLMLNAYHTIGQTPVLIREDEAHREEREILDPIFQPKQLARYSAAMSAHAEQAQRAWTDGATIDIQQEMLEMTLRIMGKVVFDVDGLCATDPLAASLTTIADYLAQGVRTPLLLPLGIPTPDNIRVRRALDVVHRRLQVAIDERRSGGLAGKMDFLAMLLKAQDADGAGLSDAQVRDDTVEIFNAGHSNVGVALAWCVYLLATHPDVSARVQGEVDRVLGGRTPTYADLDQLPYTLQVVKETLRLYPPIYILSPRRALRDVTIDGYVVRQGNLILISPYTLHRRSDVFPDPERFDPDRFAPQRAQSMPAYAWIPLGAGPHTCAGSHFALMEAHVVVATLAQRVTFSLAPGQRVVPEAGPVLRQAEGCKVIIHHRT
jgi:cytochrome P450